MRNNSKLKVLTLVVMVVLIICSVRITFAAPQITSIGTSTGNSATNNNVNGISVSNGQTNNVAQPTNNVTTPPINNVPNTTVNTTIPETGAESTTMLFALIGFALISTVYTYLKIKKYNI